MAKSAAKLPNGRAAIKEILDAAGPRPSPTDAQGAKNTYAVRFADKMAQVIARDLSPRLKGIVGTTKRDAGSVLGKKQLDVNFSTPAQGLALGISLKSIHLREPTGSKRYTHNLKRNEEELRIEASGYHKRQPYAVMVGILCLPFDSCEDAKKKNPSSFGSWVRHLRPYAGRRGPQDEDDLVERIYIALYDPDGTEFRFFDIETDPPKKGRPSRLLSYAEFLDAAYHEYFRRNSVDFKWADGTEDPLDLDEIEGEE